MMLCKYFSDAFKSCIDHFKRLDIVVNNAGIFNETMEKWESTINVNYVGSLKANDLFNLYLIFEKIVSILIFIRQTLNRGHVFWSANVLSLISWFSSPIYLISYPNFHLCLYHAYLIFQSNIEEPSDKWLLLAVQLL